MSFSRWTNVLLFQALLYCCLVYGCIFVFIYIYMCVYTHSIYIYSYTRTLDIRLDFSLSTVWESHTFVNILGAWARAHLQPLDTKQTRFTVVVMRGPRFFFYYDLQELSSRTVLYLRLTIVKIPDRIGDTNITGSRYPLHIYAYIYIYIYMCI